MRPRSFNSKDTTSAYSSLDVRWLQRKGYLVPGRAARVTWSRNGEPYSNINMRVEKDSLILSYRHRRFEEPWRREEYPIPIDWTRCHYGGIRPWFLCRCGRRVALLYGDAIFACRHCLHLVYESQREQPYNRALRQAQAIIEKLGGTWAEGFPGKPKGMHWRTYSRFFREYQDAQNRSWPPWLPKVPN